MSPPKPIPPPPPAPPPNPPTYASAARGAPINMGRFGPLGDTILTGPMGALDEGKTQRKSLLGQ